MWSRAQLKAIVVLAITERTPVIAALVRTVTDQPRSVETVVAGQPTSIFRPGSRHRPWPATVFVNGATHAGRFHPKVRRLAQGLARAGFLVAVPDLPGLRLGEITPATTHALVRVALAVAGRGRVSIPAPRAAAESFAPHTLVALLPNRHPRRFAVLYSRLPRRVRVEVSALSPLRRVTRIAVPVELASAPHDKYFPPEESRSLARRSPHMRVTITSTLAHAVPRPSLHDVGALLAFDEFVVRFLRDAR